MLAKKLNKLRNFMNPSKDWYSFKTNMFNVSIYEKLYYFSFVKSNKIEILNKYGKILFIRNILVLDINYKELIHFELEEVI